MYDFDGKSYIFNGERVWLNIAEIHYFRFAAKEWRRTLSIAKASGINTVSTYCAWNYHEISEGVWDFEGDKNIAEFIDTAKELGMYVIVRPGPYICAEWAGGGIPTWTMGKEDIENRVSNPTFLELTGKWLDKVLAIVLPRQITKGGNVISVQNDNEYPGGWDEKSESYVLNIYKMLKERGVEVAITACNAHYKEGKLAINYACGANVEKLYKDITITYNTAGEPGVIMQLKEFQPNRPTIVTELWTGPQVYFNRPIGAGYNHTESRILNFTALQTMTTLYMFQGGTNFGFYGSCGIATSYSSHYPVYEGGLPTNDYYGIKLAGAYVSTFGDLIADCDFETEDKFSSVQHTKCGDVVYKIFPKENYEFNYNGRNYKGFNESCYIVTPVNFNFFGNTIDYTDLCLLAKHKNVLYMYGNAGERYKLSVNGEEKEITVKRHDVVVVELTGAKILILDRYFAKRMWIMNENEVILGTSLAYEDNGVKVITGCPKDSKVIYVTDGNITYGEIEYQPPSKELPKLESWQIYNSFETIKPEKIEKPLALHMHGVNFGYMWYTAEMESECDKTTALMLSCYSGRVLVYLNGRFAGIFGDKRDGSPMRWDYQKPTDSFNERVVLDIKKGINKFVFLAEDTGYSFDDIKPLGIMGDVYADTRLELINLPEYVGETALSDEAREYLYSRFTYQREKYHTIEFDLDIKEDETFFFMIQGHPCWISVNGEDAKPVKQANKMWQLFAHTVIWTSYKVDNAKTHNRVRIQYIGKTEDIIAKTRIYVAKKNSILTNWSKADFKHNVEYKGREDFKNVVAAASTLLVPSGDLGGFVADFEPKYFTTTFEGKDYGPLFLNIGKMKKGQIYLNGHNLGRMHGTLPQTKYYIPDAYLEEHNVLTIFEEYGITPQDVKLMYPCPPYKHQSLSQYK
ncbi:MAG: beta-galactosidase [Clostridia bacterium]|nr:beta-galactosidase [Clostridia bacterium]